MNVNKVTHFLVVWKVPLKNYTTIYKKVGFVVRYSQTNLKSILEDTGSNSLDKEIKSINVNKSFVLTLIRQLKNFLNAISKTDGRVSSGLKS